MKKGILKIAGSMGIGVIGIGAVGTSFVPNSVLKSDEKTILSTSIVGLETVIVCAYAANSIVKGAHDYAENVLNEHKKLTHQIRGYAAAHGFDAAMKVYNREIRVIDKLIKKNEKANVKNQGQLDKLEAFKKSLLDVKKSEERIKDVKEQEMRNETLKKTTIFD